MSTRLDAREAGPAYAGEQSGVLTSLRQQGRSGTRKAPSLAGGLEGGLRELVK